MRIERVELLNFGRYESAKFKFGAGMIGVFGPNGSGKTTVLNGIYGCLTNDFQRFGSRSKDTVIRDTADSDAESYVSIEATHNDQKFSLTRWLRPAKSELRLYGSKKAITKATDIQTMIEELLGGNRQLLDNYIFVDQGALYAFLSQAPAERSKTFQHLCQTTKATQIYDEVKQTLDTLAPLANFDGLDNLKADKARLVDATRELERTEDGISRFESSLLAEERVAKYEKQLARYAQYRLLRTRRGELAGEISGLQSKRDLAYESKSHAAGLLRMATEHECDTEEAATGAAVVLAALAKNEAVEKQRKALQRRLDDATAHKPQPSKKPDGETDGKDASSALSDLARQHTSDSELLGAFDRDGVTKCPTCGTSVKNLTKQIDSARERESMFDSKVAALHKRMAAAAEYDGRQKQYEQAARERDLEIRSLKQQLQDLDRIAGPSGSRDKTSLQADVDAATDARRMRREAEELLSENSRAFGKLDAQLQAVKAELKRCDEALEGGCISSSEKESIEAKLCDHRSSAAKLAELRATRKAQLAIKKDLKERVVAARARLSQTKRARKLVKHLEEVRLVCKHDAWPRVVAQNYLELLEVDINRVLKTKLGDPFMVKAQDGLSFDVTFPGRPPRPAEVNLSGGQKVVFALAFRQAINSLFASEIGLLCLDEPTVFLDDNNIACLQDALNGMANDARSRGCQVIVITHEDRLRPAFDQLVEMEV